MRRFGQVCHCKPGCAGEYIRQHAATWPGVLAAITQANLRNYSIYRRGDLLFTYVEYHGCDYTADMARIAANPEVQRWWAVVKPLMEPLADRGPGEWWAAMDEIFHLD